MDSKTATPSKVSRKKEVVESVVIRFAGDSGDGIQLTGTQFSNTAATAGNDLATFPDYPSEIRAPAGTRGGVSGYQIQIASSDIHTVGDHPDVLVAFNPAALMVNLKEMLPNSVIIANTDSFTDADLKKAACASNPLEDGSLKGFQVFKVAITSLTIKALEGVDIPPKDKERCKNAFVLGMLYYLYSRPVDNTLNWYRQKFGKKDQKLVDANSLALKAGYAYAESAELFRSQYVVPPAKYERGTYRNISGNEAAALGLIAGAKQAGRPLFYGSYPITPATEILQELSKHKNFGVITFQAEDEIAGVTSAIGASYAGAIGTSGTSGPGLSLKIEALGLAVIAELPLVIVDVQRAGPSTGLPTKMEQSDLFQAVFGRHGESPVCVLAAASPADCFGMAVEAVRLAVKYMCPVLLLTDGYIGQGAEPWRIPKLEELPKIDVKFRTDPANFAPYMRDEKTLARPWAIPGTPGLEHRVGGLEKSHIKGAVSHDQENHDFMCRLRASKIERIVQDVPDQKIEGAEDAKILVVSWGSTYGAMRSAREQLEKKGIKVAHAHLKYLNPLPANLGKIVARYKRVLVPELNLGQLTVILRSKYLVDARGINKIPGRPFKVSELVNQIEKEAKTL